jgi:hypothetical protein
MSTLDSAAADSHVGSVLALHFLGSLRRERSDQVHRHLESCAACRVQADQVCETVAAMALLIGEHDDAAAGRGLPAGKVSPEPAAGEAPNGSPSVPVERRL